MKKIITPAILVLAMISVSMQSDKVKTTLYDFKANTIEGTEFNFSRLKGKKVMIVNVASECGYTPQYADLQALYEKYKDKNFEIIGFPCNQFGEQEPGPNDTIKAFCKRNYGVTFQMMDKIDVKGENQHPVYKWLTHKSENGVEDSEVTWNFNKYLVDENGNYVRRCSSKELPGSEAITNWIEGKK
jgi:glutathione peroxidase